MMELSAVSLWEWTKLTVRSPRTAAALVKAANLPLNVSILMIVLAGVLSGVASGLLDYVIGSPPMMFELADGQTVTFDRGGPLAQGMYAVVTGLALALVIHRVGRAMGGQGSLADIMAVTAVLQLVMTLILVAQTVALLVVPFAGVLLIVFGLLVFLRGLVHAVNIGHNFDSLGRSAWVIVLSFLVILILAFALVAVLGIGPQGVVQ